MNETFDIKRLGRLIKYEVTNYIPNYFKSLLIFASVIAAVWIFSLTVDFDVCPHSSFLLICSYEGNGENPELVIYKKR